MNTDKIVDRLRKDILRVAIANNKGHIASSLSCLDILVMLYYKIADKNDTIILSKGHGCYGLYAIWADLGLLDKGKWERFELSGCLDNYGSLGHGLPVAVGIAFANKRLGNDYHTWVIVGEGELQEGSCWEALSFMYHHMLTNITVIVDNNNLQAMDWIGNILYGDLFQRLQGWGFITSGCDGHSHKQLRKALADKPIILLAQTVKGKGIKCMENNPIFHYRVPNKDEYSQ